ncbi:MAG: Xaa-Pro peptidase family protein [Anaerolineales bacterium]
MLNSTVLLQPEEYQERVTKLTELVKQHDLDVFIVTGEHSILYLTGIPFVPLERPFFIFIWVDRAPELLVPMLERDYLGMTYSVHNISTYWDYPASAERNWQRRLLEKIGAAKRIGVEPTCPADILGVLGADKAQIYSFVDDLRLIKSPAEIGLLRYAARYADQCVERVLAAAYDGVSLLELFGQSRGVQLTMLKEVGYNAYTSSVLAGAWPAPDNSMPHAVPTLDTRYHAGPHISGGAVRVHGYTAESERTFFLREPDGGLKKAFDAMREARRRAFAAARSGAVCAEVDTAANDFLRSEGYGNNLRHRCGHGFGLGTHEGPWVSEGSKTVLQPGMLISIEPGIYISNVGGIRHSDTVLITENGNESLTHFPDDFESMMIRGTKPFKQLMGAITRRIAGVA